MIGVDFQGRYYGRALGRFTSPDPLLNSGRLGNPQSWNRYVYVFNNPLSLFDPTGLFTWDNSFGGGCTDKQLKGGKCDGFDKDQGKSIVNDRTAFRDQLSRLNKSDDASLRADAAAIGAEGKDNGVHVFLGGVGDGAAAQVNSSKPLSLDGNGNPILDLHVRDGRPETLSLSDWHTKGLISGMRSLLLAATNCSYCTGPPNWTDTWKLSGRHDTWVGPMFKQLARRFGIPLGRR